jgi:hypothetical protein
VIELWHREDLKDRAKQAMRTNGYWKGVWLSLVLLMLTANIGWGGSDSNIFYRLNGINQNQYLREVWRNIPLAAWFWGFAVTVALLYKYLVVNPLIVGRQRYFLEHRSRRVNPSLVFRSFGEGYWNIVRTLFMRDLIVFVFSLLLLVPGIIKSYQYYLVPSILAENPKMNWRRALRLSWEMTQGEKMEIWVIELSFIGWSFIATAVTIGVFLIYSSLIRDVFQNLYDRFLALTHANPISRSTLEWFLGSNDDPIVYANGYILQFLSLHLYGLIVYYLSLLMSSITQIFVAPYYYGTFADLYAVVRARALVRGQASTEELPGFVWPDEEALEEAMRPDEPPKVLVEAPDETNPL